MSVTEESDTPSLSHHCLLRVPWGEQVLINPSPLHPNVLAGMSFLRSGPGNHRLLWGRGCYFTKVLPDSGSHSLSSLCSVIPPSQVLRRVCGTDAPVKAEHSIVTSSLHFVLLCVHHCPLPKEDSPVRTGICGNL